MSLDNLDLRSLIKHIAWKRIALIMGVILFLHFVFLHGWYFRMLYKKALIFGHTITMPFHSIGDSSHATNSEVFNLCVLAMLLITIIGIVKVLRERR